MGELRKTTGGSPLCEVCTLPIALDRIICCAHRHREKELVRNHLRYVHHRPEIPILLENVRGSGLGKLHWGAIHPWA